MAVEGEAAGAAAPAPVKQDWEARSAICVKQLEKLVSVGPTPAGADALSLHLAQGFRASALVPSRTKVRVSTDALEVQDGIVAPAGPMDAQQLAQELRHLFEGLDSASLHWDLELLLFVPDPVHPRTRTRLVIRGLRGTARVQITCLWTLTWDSTGASSTPQLLALELENFVQVLSSQGAWFEDCTTSVLEHESFYKEQLLAPLSHLAERVDWNLGMRARGLHGLALGDANGDGLLDVYLPQPGGIPNKLLLQRSDGTLHDIGSTSGADFVEASRAALFADWDNDGNSDLAVSVGDWIVFLAGDGKGQFQVAQRLRAPGSTSLVAADIDLDGDLDVYVCRSGLLEPGQPIPEPLFQPENGPANILLENFSQGGALDFRRTTIERGLDDHNEGFSMAAGFEDFDLDGDSDLYVANDFGTDNLYLNENGHFREVSSERGIRDMGAGSGVAWADFDLDGRHDLLVSGAFSALGLRTSLMDDFLPQAAANERGACVQYAGGNTLWLQNRDGSFRDETRPAGLSAAGFAQGAVALDIDNDGRRDAFAPCGSVSNARQGQGERIFWGQIVPLSTHPGGSADTAAYHAAWQSLRQEMATGGGWGTRERQRCYLALAAEPIPAEAQADAPRDVRMLDISGVSGLDLPLDGRSAVAVDWDRDGRQDLIFTSRDSPRVRWMQNRIADKDAWIAVRLVGTQCNKDAVGARVEIRRQGAPTLIDSRRLGEGFLAGGSPWLHFGLGQARTLESVVVHWPGGASESFEGLRPGARFILTQGKGMAEQPGEPPPASAFMPKPIPVFKDESPARVVLAVRASLPAMNGIDPKGQALGLVPRRGQARLVLLYSIHSAAGKDELERWAAAKKRLQSAPLEILALCIDVAEDWPAAEALLESMKWPYAQAVATPNTRAVLDQIQRSVSDISPPLTAPCSLWIDRQGKLALVQRGASSVEDVYRELDLLRSSSEATFKNALPRAGRTLLPPPTPAFERLASNLRAAGLENESRDVSSQQERARTTSPAELALRMGRGRWQQEEAQAAVDLFAQAVELDPTMQNAREAWALSLCELGLFELSIDVLRESACMQPGQSNVHNELARVLVLAGRDAKAARELAVLEDLAPPIAAIWKRQWPSFVVERGQRRVEARDFLTGLADYEAALELDGTRADAWAGKGVCQRRLMRTDEAIASLQYALSLDPDQHAWRLELGLAYLDAADLDSATAQHRALQQAGYRMAGVLEQALLARRAASGSGG